MKAAVLALAFGIAAAAAAHAQSGARARHVPAAAHQNVRHLAVIAHGAKHRLSTVRRSRGVYRPRRGDFGFF